MVIDTDVLVWFLAKSPCSLLLLCIFVFVLYEFMDCLHVFLQFSFFYSEWFVLFKLLAYFSGPVRFSGVGRIWCLLNFKCVSGCGMA